MRLPDETADMAAARRPPVHVTGGDPLDFDGMDRAFAEAVDARSAEVSEGTYAFAGRPVRFRVAGARLAVRTRRAFVHLQQPREALDVSSSLQIDLWDEIDTGVPCPSDAGASDPDRQWIACGGMLTASADGRYVSFQYKDSITILDRQKPRILGCRRGSYLSGGDYSKPLVLMLSIWFHDRGVQILHAGLIARDGAGVLLPGESGTGKSTTCLASAAQGLEFLGDDFVGLERAEGGSFVGHSIFSTACLGRNSLERFPGLQSRVVDDHAAVEEKPILFLSEIYPAQLRPTVAVRAVALIRIGHAHTEVRPARRIDAWREFAASTLHTVVPRPGREALEMIGALVERVPAYWLLLGPDIRDVGPGIDRILSDPGGRDVS